MTDESRIDRTFEAHEAFEATEDDRFASTTTPFDVAATAAGDPPTFEVTVTLPTLPAAVAGDVGDAVADGWYETLSIRLEDAYDVARRADGEIDVERDRERSVVQVRFTYTVSDPERGVDDAAALVDFVEGTYVQGVIPGYDYEPPVANLLSRARRNAQAGEKR